MKRTILAFAFIWPALAALPAAEYHVAITGNDESPGSLTKPLRTIQRAADQARPGDAIVVHEGLYRERINPPRGGESDTRRITFQAAPGETVEIRGSEVVAGWVRVQDDTWKAVVPNSFFGRFNPFADEIHGDWFVPLGRKHHTGAVYLNGVWLAEAAKLDDVLAPVGKRPPQWFGQVEDKSTNLWAQFPGVDPNKELVEVNVRQSVFYPDQPGRNYITVRGFTLRHAATPWAPPTAQQIGLIGTHWSRGWIIEHNTISHSVCTGITLGKHGDEFDNTSANTADGYVKTIERALAFRIPWTKEQVGGHIVRDNHISHCEQAGVVGSLGGAFSVISGNTIHDIHVRKLFNGAEQAGIKLHGAIDTVISGNHIYATTRGLWLDWMAQGARVTRNLFHENAVEDVYMEVNHGPFLVDNNVFLSELALRVLSEGGAYVHNLFAGTIVSAEEPGRKTPYHPAHSTAVAGLVGVTGGDDRYYNNLMVGTAKVVRRDRMIGGSRKGMIGYGLWVYDQRQFPLFVGGNAYVNGAKPYAKEADPLVVPEGKLDVASSGNGAEVTLQMDFTPALQRVKTKLVTTALLGKAKVPNLPFVAPDGTPLRIDADFFGRPRNPDKPTPGPFENPAAGPIKLIEARGLAAVAPAAANVRLEKDVDYLGAGRTEKADLYLPAKVAPGERRPGIVIIHGGGWSGGDKAAARERNIGTTLAQHGYVCLSINYVLSKVGSTEVLWPRNLHDCKTAVRWLRKHAERLQLDKDHIGAIGGSAGGHLTTMVALTGAKDGLDPAGPYGEFSCRVQAAVDLYGPADLLHWQDLSMLGSRKRTAAPELYRAASLATYADKDDPPILIIQGTADKVVNVQQSKDFAAALARAGTPHQLVIVEGGEHGFHLEPKQQDLRPLVLGFFDRNLNGK